MSAADPETLSLARGERMPNSRLPVLIYRRALTPEDARKAGAVERMFSENGWGGVWRNGVYDFDHFHSNAHEALGVAEGTAQLQLGGDHGRSVEIAAGDVLVLPAGTGHRRLDASEQFVIIGAYPPGQERYDICRESSPEAELRIAKLAMPPTDPVRGKDGPLNALWK